MALTRMWIFAAALFLIGIVVARLNYLYGRSAFEAGEVGSTPFIPIWFYSVPRLVSFSDTKSHKQAAT